MDIIWKMRVTAYIVILGLLVGTWIPVASGARSCGTLKCVFEGTKARIRWYPEPWVSNEKDSFIFNVGHRWYRDGNGIELSDRITFDSETRVLNISNFSSSDEGMYKVQCRYGLSGFPLSKILDVKMPVTSQQPVTTKLASTTSGTNLVQKSASSEQIGIGTDITIVVVSLCVVIIVVVISGTVILMCRKRMQREEDHQRLAEKIESPLTSRVEGDGASVYNEIDVKYESSFSRYISQVPTGSKNPVTSPSLPKRGGPAGHNEAQYSNVNKGICKNENPKTEGKRINTYAEVETKPNKTGESESKDLKNMYASVKPKDQRHSRDNAPADECSYAKPISKKDRAPKGQGAERYSVTFPKINMATLSTNIERKDSDLMSLNEENFEAAICRSGVFRSQKRKSSKNRQLNYVEIDHSATESHDLIPKILDPPEKLEYVSIDFEKKAFVAPARKPPSSWYKRRKKKRY